MKKAMRGHRGLCNGCHKDKGVRVLYPSRSRARQNRDGLGLGNAEPPPCTEPTAAIQGTAEKIAVLAARAAAGVSLWHPLDGKPTEG